ncbi:MAG: hypothetical protein ACI9DF_005372, partial [Verrucomicrobiales bacterium]
ETRLLRIGVNDSYFHAIATIISGLFGCWLVDVSYRPILTSPAIFATHFIAP